MICEKCHCKQATEKHHKFPNIKINRELYGKLLDDDRNIQHLCYGCHHGHCGKVWHYSEREFCIALQIEPRSKTELWKTY